VCRAIPDSTGHAVLTGAVGGGGAPETAYDEFEIFRDDTSTASNADPGIVPKALRSELSQPGSGAPLR
jgi:hypothetical protein